MSSSKKTSSKNDAFKKLHPFIILGYLWPSIWPHALSFNTTCSSVSLLRRPSPTLLSTPSSSTIKFNSQMLDFTYYPFRDSILQHEGKTWSSSSSMIYHPFWTHMPQHVIESDLQRRTFFSDFVIAGHRGSPQKAPENSLESMIAASYFI